MRYLCKPLCQPRNKTKRNKQTMTSQAIFDQIKADLSENDVVLYMKGTPVFPQCGFSAAVVHILSNLGISFKGINVLEDEDVRQGIKEFANWPTIPQLYIKGEFVGGCDIVKEMYETKELQDLLKSKSVSFREAA
jgi:monothiol glutaredoxin